MEGEHEEAPVIRIVDDGRGLLDLYELWVSDLYDVRTADDGQQALAPVDETVTVVLLDRRMPGLNGDEVLARIRGGDLNCCVVMISAIDPAFDVIDMGLEEYLCKPVSKETIQRTVTRLVELASYDPEVREYYSLMSKKAALDAAMSLSDLKAREEYATLKAAVKDGQDTLEAGHADTVDRDVTTRF